MRYVYRDEFGHVVRLDASSMETASVQAARLAANRERPTPESGTYWYRYWIVAYDRQADEDGRMTEVEVARQEHLAAIHPNEPSCFVGPHEWVWRTSGGGVVEELCMRCGWAREQDTWAEDPATGQGGLEAWRYHRNLENLWHAALILQGHDKYARRVLKALGRDRRRGRLPRWARWPWWAQWLARRWKGSSAPSSGR